MGTLLAAFFKNNMYNCINIDTNPSEVSETKYDCGSSVKVI